MSYKHPVSPALNPQKVTLSTSSAQSAAVAATTKSVRVCSDIDCFILIGANPTATISSVYLPAKTPQVFGIAGGQKVAAIAGGAGNLYVSESSALQ